MERKIQWNSGCFDEIDLVYDKAAEKEATSKILADLEVGALAEGLSLLQVFVREEADGLQKEGHLKGFHRGICGSAHHEDAHR